MNEMSLVAPGSYAVSQDPADAERAARAASAKKAVQSYLLSKRIAKVEKAHYMIGDYSIIEAGKYSDLEKAILQILNFSFQGKGHSRHSVMHCEGNLRLAGALNEQMTGERGLKLHNFLAVKTDGTVMGGVSAFEDDGEYVVQALTVDREYESETGLVERELMNRSIQKVRELQLNQFSFTFVALKNGFLPQKERFEFWFSYHSNHFYFKNVSCNDNSDERSVKIDYELALDLSNDSDSSKMKIVQMGDDLSKSNSSEKEVSYLED